MAADATFTIEQTGGVTIVRFDRMTDFQGFLDAITAVAATEQNHLRLWDLKNGVNVSNFDVQEIAGHAKTLFSVPSKVAVVAPEDLAYGMARVHEVFRAQPGVEYRVFRQEDEAMSWLLQ